jgi:hypothetical protein
MSKAFNLCESRKTKWRGIRNVIKMTALPETFCHLVALSRKTSTRFNGSFCAEALLLLRLPETEK